MFVTSRDKLKHTFSNSELIDVRKGNYNYELDIRKRDNEITKVLINPFPQSSNYCIVTNRRLNIPVICEPSKNLPTAIRNFLSQNDVRDPNRYFLK